MLIIRPRITKRGSLERKIYRRSRTICRHDQKMHFNIS